MMKSNDDDKITTVGSSSGAPEPVASASASTATGAGAQTASLAMVCRKVTVGGDTTTIVTTTASVEGGRKTPTTVPSTSTAATPPAPSTPTAAAAATTSITPSTPAVRSPTAAPSTSQTALFPWKLHEMLTAAHSGGQDDVVSWLPDGEAFKVYNVNEFVSNILPSYFKQTKYKSFQRQLNLWGFERILSGPQKGAYFHPKFLRGQPNLCSTLTRQRAKKVGAAPANSGKTASAIVTPGAAVSGGGDRTLKIDPAVSSAKAAAASVSIATVPFAPSLVPCGDANKKSSPATAKPKSQTVTKRKNTSASSAKAPPPKKKKGPASHSQILDGDVPPSISTILPRQVSETCLDVVNDFLLTDAPVPFEGFQLAPYDQLPMDLAEFEGFTFHLLENERYEELNHEFKFVPGSTSDPSYTTSHSSPSSAAHHQELMLPLPPPPALLPNVSKEIDFYSSCSSSSSSSLTSPEQDSWSQSNGIDEDLTDGGGAQKLLRELEQGVFGIPKTAFDTLPVYEQS